MNALLRWLDPILNPLACLPPPPETQAESDAESLLRRLDILLRQKLKHAMPGEQKSPRKGQGLDFADLREYNPGDDIRKIDWNVFARTLTPHIREYHEEKQLTLWLVVDLTPSMRFGQTTEKIQKAVEIAGIFSLLAERSGHQLGAYLLGGPKPEIIPPGANPSHYRHVVQRTVTRWKQDADALSPSGAQQATDLKPYEDPLESGCQQLFHLVKKNSTVIFLSDFLSQNWQASLGKLSHKARLLSVLLVDPSENALPERVGLLELRDPETRQRQAFDTHCATAHTHYRQAAERQQQDTLISLKTFGSAMITSTEQSTSDTLLALLKTGNLAP